MAYGFLPPFIIWGYGVDRLCHYRGVDVFISIAFNQCVLKIVGRLKLNFYDTPFNV